MLVAIIFVLICILALISSSSNDEQEYDTTSLYEDEGGDFEETVEEFSLVAAVTSPVVVKTVEQEKTDVQAVIDELDESILLAQKMVDASPGVSIAAWHIQNARDWGTSSKDKLKNSRFSLALADAQVALFHSELAVDVVLEYRSALTALSPTLTPAAAPLATSVEGGLSACSAAVLPVNLGLNPAVAAPNTAADALVPTNSVPAVNDVIVSNIGACEEAAISTELPVATNELPGSDLEVEDKYQPEFCQSEDSEIDAMLPEWRKLSLLIARASAIVDMRIKDKFVGFSDVTRYLNLAMDFSKAAEDAQNWGDVPGNLEDGLFWARLAIQAATKFLAGNDYVVHLPSSQWDTANDTDDEAADVQSAVSDMALSLVDARVSIGRAHGAPETADYHFDQALAQMELACRQYPRSWEQAQDAAEQGFFFAGLAAETAEGYIIERDALYNGSNSTIDEGFEAADPDYVSDQDETVEDARSQWREFVLRMALLEAFHTVRCPLFNDARAHMRSAQAFVVKMNDSTDWDQVPGIASGGNIFIDIAYADAVKFLARS